MRTYQTLSLIGCILGVLLTIGLALVVGGLMSVSDTFMNMSRPTENELQQHTESQKGASIFVGGAMISFFIYIIILVITFAVKRKTKAVGITILVLGILTMLATNFWGIIPFALLLQAGIVALRYKPRKKGMHVNNASTPTTSSKSSQVGGSNDVGNNLPDTTNNPSKVDPIKNETVDTNQLNVIPIATENIIDAAEDVETTKMKKMMKKNRISACLAKRIQKALPLWHTIAILSLIFGIVSSYPDKIYSQVSDCDSAYPDFCIASAPPDLNCPDISDNDFTVLSPDPHGFDRDADGIGCES